MEAQIIVHTYKAVKFNRCDIHYEIIHALPTTSTLTERVKVEAFQGYSNAQNLGEYFRLRGATNWKDGKQLTGLWRTNHQDIFYGDRRTNSGRSLMIFIFSNNRETMRVYTFQDGYYPSRSKTDQIIAGLIS